MNERTYGIATGSATTRIRAQNACNAPETFLLSISLAPTSRFCPALSPRRNKIRDIYDPPRVGRFRKRFPAALRDSFIYRRWGALRITEIICSHISEVSEFYRISRKKKSAERLFPNNHNH